IYALRLLFGRLYLLIGRLQFLVSRLLLLDDRLEIFPARGQLLPEASRFVAGFVLPRPIPALLLSAGTGAGVERMEKHQEAVLPCDVPLDRDDLDVHPSPFPIDQYRYTILPDRDIPLLRSSQASPDRRHQSFPEHLHQVERGLGRRMSHGVAWGRAA